MKGLVQALYTRTFPKDCIITKVMYAADALGLTLLGNAIRSSLNDEANQRYLKRVCSENLDCSPSTTSSNFIPNVIESKNFSPDNLRSTADSLNLMAERFASVDFAGTALLPGMSPLDFGHQQTLSSKRKSEMDVLGPKEKKSKSSHPVSHSEGTPLNLSKTNSLASSFGLEEKFSGALKGSEMFDSSSWLRQGFADFGLTSLASSPAFSTTSSTSVKSKSNSSGGRCKNSSKSSSKSRSSNHNSSSSSVSSSVNNTMVSNNNTAELLNAAVLMSQLMNKNVSDQNSQAQTAFAFSQIFSNILPSEYLDPSLSSTKRDPSTGLEMAPNHADASGLVHGDATDKDGALNLSATPNKVTDAGALAVDASSDRSSGTDSPQIPASILNSFSEIYAATAGTKSMKYPIKGFHHPTPDYYKESFLTPHSTKGKRVSTNCFSFHFGFKELGRI